MTQVGVARHYALVLEMCSVLGMEIRSELEMEMHIELEMEKHSELEMERRIVLLPANWMENRHVRLQLESSNELHVNAAEESMAYSLPQSQI